MNFQKNKSEGARSEILQEIIHYGEHRKIQSHGWLYFWAPTGALVVTHVQTKWDYLGNHYNSANAHNKFMKQMLELLERMFPSRDKCHFWHFFKNMVLTIYQHNGGRLIITCWFFFHSSQSRLIFSPHIWRCDKIYIQCSHTAVVIVSSADLIA